MNNIPSWLTLKEAPTFPKWKLIEVQYIDTDNPCNNGSVNTYTRVENKDGAYLSSIKVWQEWPGDRASEMTKPITQANDYCGKKYGATFYMSGDSSFDPNKGQSGPYSFYVDGNSDVVSGAGLPLKRHVQFIFVWRYTENPTPPPTEGHWELVDANNRDNPQLKWVV